MGPNIAVLAILATLQHRKLMFRCFGACGLARFTNPPGNIHVSWEPDTVWASQVKWRWSGWMSDLMLFLIVVDALSQTFRSASSRDTDPPPTAPASASFVAQKWNKTIWNIPASKEKSAASKEKSEASKAQSWKVEHQGVKTKRAQDCKNGKSCPFASNCKHSYIFANALKESR